MVYNSIIYNDLYKSSIFNFFFESIKHFEEQFNKMSVSGTDILEEESIELDLKKIEIVVHREKFNIVLLGEKIRLEINRNPINNQKIGIGIIEESSEISSFMFKHFDYHNLIYGKREHNDYVGWDLTLDYDYWVYWKMPIPEPMIYIPVFDFNNPNKKELSIEHIPCHAHYMRLDEELIFEAAWQMYFGEVYYKYIPKPLFDDFSDCFENIILENGIRRITLYKDLNAFKKPENIDKFWSFRRKLGIDSIAHELTRGKNRIEPENLPVLITKQNCEKGQTRVTRFLNKQNKLISANLASKKEIKEYLDDGITVVFEKIEKII